MLIKIKLLNVYILVISISYRKLLSDKELSEIFEACDMAAELNNFKSRIYEYVESRMTFIAPNLTAIVGKFHVYNKII